jgi:hypothetical protein
MKVEKGMLVYIPADVKLYQEYSDGGAMIPRSFIITTKPINCLVVGSDDAKPIKKFNVIYEGMTWTVKAKDVYEVNKEKENVSYIG